MSSLEMWLSIMILAMLFCIAWKRGLHTIWPFLMANLMFPLGYYVNESQTMKIDIIVCVAVGNLLGLITTLVFNKTIFKDLKR